MQPENLQLIDLGIATKIFCNIADQLTGAGDAGLLLHDIVLPTIVTMFTVILSIAACILLLIIKRQWETLPEYRHHQHQQVTLGPNLNPDPGTGQGLIMEICNFDFYYHPCRVLTIFAELFWQEFEFLKCQVI